MCRPVTRRGDDDTGGRAPRLFSLAGQRSGRVTRSPDWALQARLSGGLDGPADLVGHRDDGPGPVLDGVVDVHVDEAALGVRLVVSAPSPWNRPIR